MLIFYFCFSVAKKNILCIKFIYNHELLYVFATINLKNLQLFLQNFIPAFENTPSAERVRRSQAVVATGMLFAILHGKNFHQSPAHHIQVFPPRLNFIRQHFHLNNGVNRHLAFPVTAR